MINADWDADCNGRLFTGVLQFNPLLLRATFIHSYLIEHGTGTNSCCNSGLLLHKY